MVESILRTVKQVEGLQGPLAANIWDQGDAVGAWTGKNLACVLFPTAATLDRVGAGGRVCETGVAGRTDGVWLWVRGIAWRRVEHPTCWYEAKMPGPGRIWLQDCC